MATSTGISAETGRPLTDWEHVQQSIRIILTTPIGSRVMRREFGSRLPDLIDGKLTARTILQLYSEAASAIERWEPRFRVNTCAVDTVAATGKVTLVLFGSYYPKGHRGDYSVAEDVAIRTLL